MSQAQPHTAAVEPNGLFGPTTPLFIVLNVGSGAGDANDVACVIRGTLAAGGRPFELLLVEDPEQLSAAARRAVALALERKGAVVAAGGDGTLSTVAQVALRARVAFGVIPLGTFNYFGRSHDISSDVANATSALLDARVRPVQVGLVNDRIFLVNASVGLYPQLLEDREALKHRVGRNRFVAALAAVATIVRGFRPMRIEVEHVGAVRTWRALTLFVGNNRLQLAQVGIAHAHAVEEGALVVVVVPPMSVMRLMGLLLRGALGRLGHAHGIEALAWSSLTVRPASSRVRRLKVATDGETVWMDTPLRIQVSPVPLLLLMSRVAPDSERVS